MQTHDGHYVNLRADHEGVWFDLETDTGERVNECLPWEQFHRAYQAWLDSRREKNEMEELDNELKRTGLG